MTDNGPNNEDRIDDLARRAGAGLRSGRVPASSSRIPRRRLARRRAVLASTGVVAAVATVASLIAVNRPDDLKVGTATTFVTETSVAATTTVPPSTTAVSATTPTTGPPTTAFVPTTAPCPTVLVPEAKDLPALIVADGKGAARVTGTQRETLTVPPDTRIAFRLSTCSAIVHEGDPATPQIGISGGQWATDRIGAPDGYHLIGVGRDNGDDILILGAVLVIGQPAPPLLLYDVQTGALRTAKPSTKAENALGGSIAGGHLLIDANDSGVGVLEMREVRVLGDSSAPVLQIRAPKGDFGMRSYTLAKLDPTGKTVAFLDTPDWAPDQPDLVVRDIASGRELLRLSLPWPAWPTFLDYDGRFVVISRLSAEQNGSPLPALVLDTAASNPAFRQAGAAVGIVTLDRSAP